jgi:hypothetical protein
MEVYNVRVPVHIMVEVLMCAAAAFERFAPWDTPGR